MKLSKGYAAALFVIACLLATAGQAQTASLKIRAKPKPTPTGKTVSGPKSLGAL